MANHKSAIKRHRQSEERQLRNQAVRSRVRSTIKNARAAIESKDEDAIALKLRDANQILYKAVSQGVLKPNTASRKLSRLSKAAHTALIAES